MSGEYPCFTFCEVCFSDKKHGEQCTEKFYKDQVEEHLSTQKAKQDGSMQEILQRVEDAEEENSKIPEEKNVILFFCEKILSEETILSSS